MPVADHMPVAEHPLLSQPVELESATTQPIAAEQSPVSQPVETLPVAVEPMVMSAGGDEEDVVAEGVPDDLASAELAAPANLTNGNGNGDGPPAVGVEVLSTEDRKGTKYFSIRDLRNGNVIHNVSLTSARKLWSYAINQHQTNPVNPGKVTWNGDIGLWQVARRAKKLRYDLVLRQSDGHMRVFYGVTADGMLGHWQQFLKDEDKAE
jgi:hypothetical protein